MATKQPLTRFDPIISEASKKYGVPENLIKSVIKQESGFNPNARSPVGAQGLMQLMPATARELGVKNSLDPYQNIMGGTKYLADRIKQFGSIPLGLAAYNAGAGNVKKYGGIPPFKETQNYVKRIMSMFGSGDFDISGITTGGSDPLGGAISVGVGGGIINETFALAGRTIAILVLFIVGIILLIQAFPVEKIADPVVSTIGKVAKPVGAINKVRKKLS